MHLYTYDIIIGMDKWQYQKSGVYKRENNPNWRGGKEVSCTFCGKLIYRRPWELKSGKNHFCSRQCHDEFRRKPKNRIPASEMHGPKHPRWSGSKFCKICNKELFDIGRRKMLLCDSEECKQESRRRGHKKLSGENHPDWKGGKVTLKCQVCNKEFQVSPHKANKALYCSNECRHIGKRNRVTIQCLQCGKEVTVSAVRFNELNARFCSVGCFRSYQGKTSIESKVLVALEELKIKYIDEYRPKGTRKTFDFYLPDLNILIEADGDFWHHSQWATKSGNSKRDREKDQWAIDNGFKLIRLRESDIEKFGAIVLLQKDLFSPEET